ncbi:MAG: Acyl-CoA dehydrogenase/oxidase domain protein [uncultured Rubrobacteraceae bacterium]|uniref:Acyl-CoA dehydrogenase/oxidase domain protein n=1 Tax=uncultured Rubrobacteraceae bacterium TaxID=349277 RepID=A0A6J4NY16_9ACTN|nr:MAG: Acyl-CoA dehydrogenase/oxidase domain protein [uncultured Rubrobacteraceae bacterium]
MRTRTPGHGPREKSRPRELNEVLDEVLSGISAGAAARDAEPAFPEGPFRNLAASGVLGMTAPGRGDDRAVSFEREWCVLRAVARADGSVGRILDGHFNAVERVSVLAPEPLRSAELEAITAGELRLGVWGADPIPGEGEPARLLEGGARVSGVKTFCSGSTGLDRAVVLVRGEDGAPGPPLVAYVDLSEGAAVDTTWFRGYGMRSSESHRVVFDGARVLAVLGRPGELLREPYFSRDAVRTAVTWAGIADLAVGSALDLLATKSAGRDPDDLVSLAAGKLLTAQGTMDRWLEFAAATADRGASLSGFSTQLREAVASACRDILDEATRAVGSHPFATAGPLDRARRDLELYLLQHRLEPALARRGRAAIGERRP